MPCSDIPPPGRPLQLITLIPTLLHRTGLADDYKGWRTATWPWVGRAFPPTAPAALPGGAGPLKECPSATAAASSVKDGSCGTPGGASGEDSV